MNSPIEPIFDRVVLLEDDPKEMVAGGIVVPAIAQEKTKTATVMAVGPYVQHVKPGDHVIHTRYSGMEIEIDRKTYLIVAELELMGILAPVPVLQAV